MSSDSIVSAVILDSNLQQTPFSQAVSNPLTNTNASGRLDYQLTENNTLTARYQLWQNNGRNSGIGQFSLVSQAYNSGNTEHDVQISDSQVLNARAVTDFRLELVRDSQNQTPVSEAATLQVIGAFTGGGNSQGYASDTQDHVEVQNLTTLFERKAFPYVRWKAARRGPA